MPSASIASIAASAAATRSASLLARLKANRTGWPSSSSTGLSVPASTTPLRMAKAAENSSAIRPSTRPAAAIRHIASRLGMKRRRRWKRGSASSLTYSSLKRALATTAMRSGVPASPARSAGRCPAGTSDRRYSQ